MGFFEVFAAALAGFYALIPSFGLAIILLTFLVKLILLPLAVKQTRSMREMQLIQPEVKKIQSRYKGDRQKMNEEMMKLYKERGVNPLGGCLPMLVQMPVLIGLFYVIRQPLQYMGYRDANASPDVVQWVVNAAAGVPEVLRDSSLAHALQTAALETNRFLGFLRLDCSPQLVWAGKPSPAVPEAACGTGLVSVLPYLLLIVLMGATTYWQQKQIQAKTVGDAQAQQMQMFGKIMPVMLMFFSFTFPTGVVLYWLTSNVWTIIQQKIMLRVAPAEEGAAALPSDGKAGRKGGAEPSGVGGGTGGDGRRQSGGKQAKAGAGKKKRKR